MRRRNVIILNLFLITVIVYNCYDGFSETIGKSLGLYAVHPIDYQDDQICIEYNFLEATESFRYGLEPVSLAIHGTSDVLGLIERMPGLWDGPISVGVFLDSDSLMVLEYLRNLHKCDRDFNRKVTIHFAYRKSIFQKGCRPVDVPMTNLTCREFMANRKSWRIPSSFLLYPYSMMRNVARRGAKSDLHFVIDADMVPSIGVARDIMPVANALLDGKRKVVLLIRRFETRKGADVPRTVADLKMSMRAKRTFEFHYQFHPNLHLIKNLPYWFTKSRSSDNVSAWEIEPRMPHWEPQPILHRNDLYAPDYVPSRVKDMVSLAFKLCRAGYSFHLASYAFTVHEGVKTSNSLFNVAVATHQQLHAKHRAHKRFADEIRTLYPDTVDKCGNFEI
uniref:I-beta-1,3-N-acetylglucosaminyltransferase n=1 Tax=Caenorhabditis tropicalis TaxID=1561998 RepID=A0A1I7UU51_9PELO